MGREKFATILPRQCRREFEFAPSFFVCDEMIKCRNDKILKWCRGAYQPPVITIKNVRD